MVPDDSISPASRPHFPHGRAGMHPTDGDFGRPCESLVHDQRDSDNMPPSARSRFRGTAAAGRGEVRDAHADRHRPRPPVPIARRVPDPPLRHRLSHELGGRSEAGGDAHLGTRSHGAGERCGARPSGYAPTTEAALPARPQTESGRERHWKTRVSSVPTSVGTAAQATLTARGATRLSTTPSGWLSNLLGAGSRGGSCLWVRRMPAGENQVARASQSSRRCSKIGAGVATGTCTPERRHWTTLGEWSKSSPTQ
ncbi:hypothetical protein LXA43DRAFT_268287 [Ganoderma leucocontextum]|nr:hypothetical protein LXA43DRAFT_268287 [Ganoderma leucocontextum]